MVDVRLQKAILVMLLAGLVLVLPAAAATTSLTVKRLANDGTTVLNTKTVDYAWLEANLPVLGDGTTHYYSQGPTFNDTDLWDDAEWQNIESRDWGAVKGTDVKDICDLVGGMSAGETVKIRASDGFSKTFPYEYVYTPNLRQGPLGITWYRADQGYVTGYSDGMRLVMFADAKTDTYGWNTSGWHVFGNADMRDVWAPAYWYNYSGTWPSSGGLAVKYVSEIIINSKQAPPVAPIAAFSSDTQAGTAPLTVHFTDQSAGTAPLAYAWDFDNNGVTDSTEQSPSYLYAAAGTYTVNLTVKNAAGSDSEVKAGYITVSAPVDEWTINLTGARNEQLTRVSFESLASGNRLTYTDASGTWSGIALWRLLARVDDSDPATFSDTAADLGYNVTIRASDGFSYTDTSATLKRNDVWIVADLLNGTPLPKQISGKNVWSLKVVGTGLTGKQKVGNVTDITLTDFHQPPAPTVDVLFDGDVNLAAGTFSFTAYNSGVGYQINRLTPHGALDAAAKTAGFTYNATDKKWATMSTMLLDDAGVYRYNNSATPKLVWAYAVNGVKKNDFSQAEGISVYRVNEGDLVEFYYGKDGDTLANANAVIRARVHVKDQTVLFDDDVTLLPGSFSFTAYNSGAVYQINSTTPHGALDAAAKIAGFTYNATDKKWATMGTMLLDDVGAFRYNNSVTPNRVWAYALNGGIKNDYSATTGISVYQLANNDRVEFFYGDKGGTLENATAVVRILVHISSTDNWTLSLKGAQDATITKQYFQDAVACIHNATYTDVSGTWGGVPLWALAGYVDDGVTHGPGAFNDTRAAEGYTVKVTASDNFNRTFTSQAVARSSGYIVANTLNGQPLPTQYWPLKLVGNSLQPMDSVAKVSTIELSIAHEQPPVAAPSVRIIKYGSDGKTEVANLTVNITTMANSFPVIGDGTTVYRFEGINFLPNDIWDANETYPGGFKIANAVRGTRIRDLCDLAGGMGSGTEIRLIAGDGYETILPYSSIYTNPAVQTRQGDAILAWYADGQYMPGYADGMRLFFTPSDHIYGTWDMHETLTSNYWHYYYQDGVQYPSAAGLSAKWISTLKISSAPESDWALDLDGRDIGGINYTVSRTYFEQALACQFGANHSASYTDNKGRTWEGMSLWFLAGFVDDADQHSDHAFNESLATAGYDVVFTARDGSSVVLDSRNIIRSSNFIVANSLNGTHIPDSDGSWPLRLVGASVSGSQSIQGIQKIRLVKQGLREKTLYFSPESSAVTPGQSVTYSLLVSSLPQGLAGFNVSISLTDPSKGEITQVTLPAWAVLKRNSVLPADVLWIEGVDLGQAINAGATNVTLATITVRGDQTGTTTLNPWVKMMTADGGANVVPNLMEGELAVHIPLIANFTADPRTGPAPFTVAFTDLSTGTPAPTNHLWDFGDGNSSTNANPSHTYASFGLYTVTLTVRNAYSQDTEMKTGYIDVSRYVEPFPTLTQAPTDPDRDGLYEDINGNGDIDYDDIVEFFWNMDWVTGNTQVGILPYDFNGNGSIDYDDIVQLFLEVE
jgi:PKD repeat protein